MPIVLLFNPKSGRGKGIAATREIAEHLRAQDTQIVEVELARTLTQADFARTLEGARALIAIGGDGTVSFAAPAVAQTNVPIYHLPLGTENLFSREFAMNANPDAISKALSCFRVKRVDLARCNNQTMLLVASFGPDASIIHRLAKKRKGAISHRTYLTPIVSELRHLTFTRHRVTVDGQEMTCDHPSIVIVANSRQYAARLDPAQDAKMDDGLLDVAILPYTTRANLIAWAGQLKFARSRARKRMHYQQGRHVTVESIDRPLIAQIDGEAISCESNKADVTINPGALPVLLPDPSEIRSRPQASCARGFC